MPKFSKKPVVIEAMLWPGISINTVDDVMVFEDWVEPIARALNVWPLKYRGVTLIIPTLEGDHEAKPGDWIIRGIQGELYPCKPDIFAATYEQVLA